mmetsp:Transcript_3352/g.9229  ORF Transcript_3352/g.9229 Transcript_3352/m.9229 type:complete len:325 (-) Transcript_3352:662-1636(-)
MERKADGSAESVPRDAQVVASILKSMGVRQYDERVVPMLMELLYRYISETLEDAKSYADFAARGNGDVIELDDIKIAIQGRVDVSFPQLPSRELLAQLARERNSEPLPALDNARPGVQLPPEADQLTSINYQIRTGAKRGSRQVRFTNPTRGSAADPKVAPLRVANPTDEAKATLASTNPTQNVDEHPAMDVDAGAGSAAVGEATTAPSSTPASAATGDATGGAVQTAAAHSMAESNASPTGDSAAQAIQEAAAQEESHAPAPHVSSMTPASGHPSAQGAISAAPAGGAPAAVAPTAPNAAPSAVPTSETDAPMPASASTPGET